ncbi:MAG: 30S ribosomal protein S4e [Infirmifilum sp.]|jgi:small subunit ribosomal protein S4e|uniref:Small ribosomal subunit protein eS4 n=1 Tax=Infirmifilum uzonense TaxID=1550241 RepID=A0A0F7FH59_9CREN|nr:30S ribosomal protein S4e [Infirmifilum uzonense]AKG38044.1 30S ribosomal protein S4e [Infirmifilum uzonense]
MTRKIKSSLRHLRRSVAPPFWPIKRKEYVWTVKPKPGPHAINKSIPLGIVLRDFLGYVTTMKEARRVLGERKISVDGRIVTDYKFPIGLMDLIHIIPEDKYYRVVPDKTNMFKLVEVSKDEAGHKLARIIRKQTVKGGGIQITLHDGRNLLLANNDQSRSLRVLDSVLITVPNQSLVSHIPLKEGVMAVVTEGRHTGFIGRVQTIQQVFKRRKSIVVLKGENGEEIRTILEYILPVGQDKPLITIR